MLIAGRFRLIERISHGTFADVWKAADHHGAPPGRLVALKLLLPSARGDPERPWEAVMREVEASARMGPHPNVLSPWAVLQARHFPEMTTPCLAMEFVDGWNLAEWLLDLGPPGPDTMDARLAVMGDLLRGLAHAHACGVVHGDLSFGNVLIRRPTTGLLADFGSARLGGTAAARERESGDRPDEVQPINPPPYDGSASPASGTRRDVYAFAVLCYLALVGRHPLSDEWQQMRTGLWHGPAHPHHTLPRRPLVSLAPWAARDERLCAVSGPLLQCLASNPADRPATAGDLLRSWPVPRR